MIKLFSGKEFVNAKSKDKLPCKCYYCNNMFLVEKKHIQYEEKKPSGRRRFCSVKCKNYFFIGQSSIVECKNCGNKILRQNNQIKKVKNSFCNNSCSAKYNNSNKKCGYRRSKMEKYIEHHLSILYPNLIIKYNNVNKLGIEFDILIEELNLAFEINGIFHYKPIYGEEKLKSTINMDKKKIDLCKTNNINLIILDISNIVRYSDEYGKMYLNNICYIINSSGKLKII